MCQSNRFANELYNETKEWKGNEILLTINPIFETTVIMH